ncbi:hypothetical protein SAMN05216403_10144 [Nitrosospira multiformis ATCC 25196]|uniref:Uncharacterized protein n=1 Tax=Nitrosospira multiformis (strain ATCC 25196 / NCIMB 11849 / C 71) TaxID=323848 RepID=A0A1H5RL96_NITMU|nr:hypothetical protein SAMN05216411_101283 [Nitrosospira multiformis]SEF39126.1 hypothetical protein SAMN05216403_10144 [Nitrosospira multiformis ATCC 25196]
MCIDSFSRGVLLPYHYAATITPANIVRRLKLRQQFFPNLRRNCLKGTWLINKCPNSSITKK